MGAAVGWYVCEWENGEVDGVAWWSEMVELERCGVTFVASFSRDSCQTLMSLLALPSISEERCLR